MLRQLLAASFQRSHRRVMQIPLWNRLFVLCALSRTATLQGVSNFMTMPRNPRTQVPTLLLIEEAPELRHIHGSFHSLDV
jgi:hypothetical protein